MGDVLLSEPVVRVLRQEFGHVTIYTDFPKVAQLMGVYDEILPYDKHLEISNGQFERVIGLVYEIYPGMNHLDGYAHCAGVQLTSRLPEIRKGFERIVEGFYGLIAPYTSTWIRPMREWPKDRFVELGKRLERRFEVPFLLLEPDVSFDQMLSLIEHCNLFVGNDSGPAILSQCFDRPTFVIFGATRPSLILLAETAVAITADVSCIGCKHLARHTEIMCATPMCLETLSVDAAFEQIVAQQDCISGEAHCGTGAIQDSA